MRTQPLHVMFHCWLAKQQKAGTASSDVLHVVWPTGGKKKKGGGPNEPPPEAPPAAPIDVRLFESYEDGRWGMSFAGNT
eukprot:1144255-Pelagomonas_calceolata.AAC.5